MRRAAMGWPILPRPTKAISAGGAISPGVDSLTIDLLERLAGDAETVDASRNAGINGDLEENLLNFVPGQAVLECRLHMQLQFVRTVQRAYHSEVDDAATAPVETGTGPKSTPAIGGGPFGHRAGELVSSRNRLLHIL